MQVGTVASCHRSSVRLQLATVMSIVVVSAICEVSLEGRSSDERRQLRDGAA